MIIFKAWADPLNELNDSEPHLVFEVTTRSGVALRDVREALLRARDNLNLIEHPVYVLGTPAGRWSFVDTWRMTKARSRAARRLKVAVNAYRKYGQAAARLVRLRLYAEPDSIRAALGEASRALDELKRLQAEPMRPARLKFRQGEIELQRGPQRPSRSRGVEPMLVRDLIEAGLRRPLARRVARAWLDTVARHRPAFGTGD